MDMNYYEILGLPQDASKDDIKRAYRTLIIKYHPDIRGESGKAFTEYLNVIHDTLLDDDRKKHMMRVFRMVIPGGTKRTSHVLMGTLMTLMMTR